MHKLGNESVCRAEAPTGSRVQDGFEEPQVVSESKPREELCPPLDISHAAPAPTALGSLGNAMRTLGDESAHRAVAPTGSRATAVNGEGVLALDSEPAGTAAAEPADEMFHTNAMNTNMQVNCVMLFDDENGIRQAALQDQGARTRSLQMRRNFNEVHIKYQLRELSALRPCLLWIRLVGTKTPRGDRHDEKQSRVVETFAKKQIQLGGHVLIEGNVKDMAWELTGHAALAENPNLHTTLHRWCNYGVLDPDDQTKVHRCTKALSTLALPDRSSCSCPPSARRLTNPRGHRHAHDLSMVLSFAVGFSKVVLKALAEQPGRPHAQQARETDLSPGGSRGAGGLRSTPTAVAAPTAHATGGNVGCLRHSPVVVAAPSAQATGGHTGGEPQQ